MNKIKIFFVGMAALVCGNVMAQKITAENVTIAPNGSADLVFSVVEADAAAALAEFELKLPEGLSIDKSSKTAGELLSETHGITITTKKKSGNTYVLIKSEEGDEFTAATGKLITLKLDAAETVAEGDYEIEILKINLTSLEATQMNTVEEGKVTVTVASTGINSISLDDPNAEVYNLNGQRVKNATKGVYVVNGKKVAVK